MSNKDLPHAPASEFLLFASDDGRVRIECRFEGDTTSHYTAYPLSV